MYSVTPLVTDCQHVNMYDDTRGVTWGVTLCHNIVSQDESHAGIYILIIVSKNADVFVLSLCL